MGLAVCPEPECQRVLDVPEIQASWRCPDGRCAACNNLTAQELMKMQIPEQIVRTLVKSNSMSKVECGAPAFKVECGVSIPPIKHIGAQQRKAKQYNGEFPFDQLKPPMPDGRQYSVFIPAPKPHDVARFANKVGISSRGYAVAYEPKAKYTRRQVVEGGVVGVRIWRTK